MLPRPYLISSKEDLKEDDLYSQLGNAIIFLAMLP